MAAAFASYGFGLIAGGVVGALLGVVDSNSEDVFNDLAYGALYGGAASGLRGAISAVRYLL